MVFERKYAKSWFSFVLFFIYENIFFNFFSNFFKKKKNKSIVQVSKQ